MSRYDGKKFGKLTMLHASRHGGGGIGSIWKAVCDCGNVLEVLARKAYRGDVTSCGNCGKGLGIQGSGKLVKQGIPDGHRQAFSKLLQQRPTADISAGHYTELVGKGCIACGEKPVLVEWMDASKEATDTELVPICSGCSGMRRGRNLVQWLGRVIRIANHLRAQSENS